MLFYYSKGKTPFEFDMREDLFEMSQEFRHDGTLTETTIDSGTGLLKLIIGEWLWNKLFLQLIWS